MITYPGYILDDRQFVFPFEWTVNSQICKKKIRLKNFSFFFYSFCRVYRSIALEGAVDSVAMDKMLFSNFAPI